MSFDVSPELAAAKAAETLRPHGKVIQVVGMVVEATGPNAPVGDICLVHPEGTLFERERAIPCEVVGFREGRILLMPYGETGSPSPAAGGSTLSTVGRSTPSPEPGSETPSPRGSRSSTAS